MAKWGGGRGGSILNEFLFLLVIKLFLCFIQNSGDRGFQTKSSQILPAKTGFQQVLHKV